MLKKIASGASEHISRHSAVAGNLGIIHVFVSLIIEQSESGRGAKLLASLMFRSHVSTISFASLEYIDWATNDRVIGVGYICRISW